MLRFRRLDDLLRWDSMLERCGGVATLVSSGNIVFVSVDGREAALLLSLRACLLGGGMGLRIVDAGGLCTGVVAEWWTLGGCWGAGRRHDVGVRVDVELGEFAGGFFVENVLSSFVVFGRGRRGEGLVEVGGGGWGDGCCEADCCGGRSAVFLVLLLLLLLLVFELDFDQLPMPCCGRRRRFLPPRAGSLRRRRGLVREQQRALLVVRLRLMRCPRCLQLASCIFRY